MFALFRGTCFNYYCQHIRQTPSWSLIVAIPASDFTGGVTKDNRIILLLSLAILVIAVALLTFITLLLSNRLAVAKVQIHDVEEHSAGIDMHSGMEKVLETLENIGAGADKYMKERIKGVISQLVSHVNRFLI